MTQSILNSTKKVLGVSEGDTAFDVDIVMHINTALSKLNQLGVGPAGGFFIEDDSATWDSFTGGDPRFNMVKSYVYLAVRQLFDPAGTSFLLQSQKETMTEMEVRLNILSESLIPVAVVVSEESV